MFVICYPSVWFTEAKMENTCHCLGDPLSGRKVQASGFICTWHRWWIILKALSISLALTRVPLLHLIFFSLFEYHMEHSFPTLSKNRQKPCLDSCAAATAVIDRDVSVFILKFWIKQPTINLPVCLINRPQIKKKKKETATQWKLYGSDNINDDFGWFHWLTVIRFNTLMPENVINLPWHTDPLPMTHNFRHSTRSVIWFRIWANHMEIIF